ncbi:acetyl-CoA C-acetyltransferase [Neobacillus sp. B4I6]|jgi:acetyl-CoA C-acetyltransferase|uniref:thiolase family protein n=1 Tax=Neobacillus sp. B4I6 TaxID=3373925 RepID=UPI003D238E64
MRDVAIVGIGQTKHSGNREDTYQELIYETAQLALKDANASIKDIDAGVISIVPDAFIGTVHPERWVADTVGAKGKPFMRVNTGGASGLSAVQVGYYHIASGLADTVLVLGADRIGESGDAQTILNRIWDPIYERAMPLNTITMLAFQAVRFMEKYGMTERHMAMVSERSHRNGVLNPNAHVRKQFTIEKILESRMISYPIKLLDACPKSSGGCALLLTAADHVHKFTDRPAWIRGIGHSSETYFMGDRVGPKVEGDHADSPALTKAAFDAYKMAGITDPIAEIDVAELYAPFSNIELHAIQDVGLVEEGEILTKLENGHFEIDGGMPINPSGGVLCANPIAATAMIRVAEAALQVTNRAGAHQVKGAKKALATGIGGDHQFFGAVVLEGTY